MHLFQHRRRALRSAAVALVTSSVAAGAWAGVAPSLRSSEPPAGATSSAVAPLRYVALGDSYTAAPGVPDPAGGGCARSTSNYPSVLARTLPGTEVVDVSCSGADTTHMTRPQRVLGGPVPPQLAALTPETDLVTIGIGGNDFGVFGTMVFECPGLRRTDPRGAPCEEAQRTRRGRGDRLLNRIADTERRLVRVVRDAQRRSPRARIMLVGYPRLVPARGTCAALPLARGDYRYATRISRALDRALRAAAERTGTELVDVWRASRGHDICSDDPWVNGGRSTRQAILYHPFAKEQAAVAGLVLARLS